LKTAQRWAQAGERIDFIDSLRGLAVLLVLWDHLVGSYLTRRHQSWWPHELISKYVNKPLGIIQDFGWFGVCLFFLISGYVITHVAQRETGSQFTIRRLLRIYPPLVVAILLAVALASLSGETVAKGWREILWGMTLLNYVRVPQNAVLGVAWTLVIEMAFYSLMALQTFFFGRRHRIAVCLNLSLCILTIACCRRFGDDFFLLAASIAYVPYLIVGQIIYLRSRGIIGNYFTVASGVVAFLAIQYGIREIHAGFRPLNNSYLLSFIFALSLFVVAMLINLKPVRLISFSAEISYSLYLVHGPVGFLVLASGFHLGLPFSVSLLLAIAAVFVVAVALNRLVERPSQALARRWTQTRKVISQEEGKAPVPALH